MTRRPTIFDAGSQPRLPEPSGLQLAFSAVWIGTAAALWVALAVDVSASVHLPGWWVLMAVLGGVASADFASGLLHWGADTWGRADMPILGPRVLVPFRVHHVNPDDFLRRSFLDTNGDVAALAIPVLVALLWMPLESAVAQTISVMGLAFCGMGTMTNQIHQWAHMPTPPHAVARLQTAGIFLRPRTHARHHGRPYDRAYCITTGWCNTPLETVDFFRRLERIITLLTGAVARHDEQAGRASSRGAATHRG